MHEAHMPVNHMKRGIWLARIPATTIASMNDVQARLGRAIAGRRAELGLTQEQLSEAAGLDQGALSRIERGKQDLSTPKLMAIAGALTIKVSDLWASAESAAGVHAGPAKPSKRGRTVANPIERAIDCLRYSIGAIAVAITDLRPAAGEAILAELALAPPEFLEVETSVVALIESVESRVKAAKARKQARAHAGA
jgi:transcriptional regulator with XRE-family HTH domain